MSYLNSIIKHPQEEEYGFQSSSSMKPTQLVQTENSINQIPGYAEINGMTAHNGTTDTLTIIVYANYYMSCIYSTILQFPWK